jgi:hypothetical protein
MSTPTEADVAALREAWADALDVYDDISREQLRCLNLVECASDAYQIALKRSTT